MPHHNLPSLKEYLGGLSELSRDSFEDFWGQLKFDAGYLDDKLAMLRKELMSHPAEALGRIDSMFNAIQEFGKTANEILIKNNPGTLEYETAVICLDGMKDLEDSLKGLKGEISMAWLQTYTDMSSIFRKITSTSSAFSQVSTASLDEKKLAAKDIGLDLFGMIVGTIPPIGQLAGTATSFIGIVRKVREYRSGNLSESADNVAKLLKVRWYISSIRQRVIPSIEDLVAHRRSEWELVYRVLDEYEEGKTKIANGLSKIG